MTLGRAAGRSKHLASMAGGRIARACQRSNVSARKAADRQFDTRDGRPVRHLGEAGRDEPTLEVPKSTRHIPWRSSKGLMMALVLDLEIV